MCCNLQTHVMVISIICLILTCLGPLNFISTSSQSASKTQKSSPDSSQSSDANTGGNVAIINLGVQIFIYVYWVVSEILCLVGAIKNNKCMLIPFMICMCLTILGCVGATILLVFYGTLGAHAVGYVGAQSGVLGAIGSIGVLAVFLMIIPAFFVLGLSIYFLVIIVKFYKELASGLVDGHREGVVLQPYAPPSVPPGGGQIVYATPGSQNVSYPKQQSPPQQQPPPTYSRLGYQPNTHGMKNPA